MSERRERRPPAWLLIALGALIAYMLLRRPAPRRQTPPTPPAGVEHELTGTATLSLEDSVALAQITREHELTGTATLDIEDEALLVEVRYEHELTGTVTLIVNDTATIL